MGCMSSPLFWCSKPTFFNMLATSCIWQFNLIIKINIKISSSVRWATFHVLSSSLWLALMWNFPVTLWALLDSAGLLDWFSDSLKCLASMHSFIQPLIIHSASNYWVLLVCQALSRYLALSFRKCLFKSTCHYYTEIHGVGLLCQKNWFILACGSGDSCSKVK